MTRKTRLNAATPKTDHRPATAPPVDEALDPQLELVRQQRYRQFRDALSPFWAWRMSRR